MAARHGILFGWTKVPRRSRVGDGRVDVLVRGRLTTLRPAAAARRRAPRRLARGSRGLALLGRRDLHPRRRWRSGSRGRMSRRGSSRRRQSPSATSRLHWQRRRLDMFLIPAARGRGLGPDAARAMADTLLHERRPRPRHRRPLRLERGRGPRLEARRLRRGLEARPADEEHTADWILMEFRC